MTVEIYEMLKHYKKLLDLEAKRAENDRDGEYFEVLNNRANRVQSVLDSSYILCIHCNAGLVMSDYGQLVCVKCEEPQYEMA